MGTGGKMLGVTCDGLASHPGGVAILLVGLMLWIRISSGSVCQLLARVQRYLTFTFKASDGDYLMTLVHTEKTYSQHFL